MIEWSEDEVDGVRTIGEPALEKPHDDHVVGQRNGVSVESVET